eukprot:scaffold1446_cov191-Alexandrium_tamarense.AAC.17
MSTLIPERMESLNVRTIEFVLGGMEEAQKAFAEHDLVANVSLETYNGDLYLRRELDYTEHVSVDVTFHKRLKLYKHKKYNLKSVQLASQKAEAVHDTLNSSRQTAHRAKRFFIMQALT